MDFAQFLNALGASARLDVGAAAESGGCTLRFDQHLEVTLEHSPDDACVQVFAPVLSLTGIQGPAREKLLSALLQLHLFGMATGGAYFGLDPALDRVIFFMTVPLEGQTPEQAVATFERFVNQLDRWQGNLLNVVQRGTATAPTAGAPGPDAMQRV